MIHFPGQKVSAIMQDGDIFISKKDLVALFLRAQIANDNPDVQEFIKLAVRGFESVHE